MTARPDSPSSAPPLTERQEARRRRILDAVGRQGPPPELLSAVRVVEHTWHSALIGRLSGRCSDEQAHGDIKTVCELIPAETPDGAHR